MKKVSIIVPVYNSEKYLNLTLTAISNQEYSNIEIIMVDDGSTDNSGTICKNMQLVDSRFHYYRVENGGPSKARNIGLQYAKGEYICFCDSDDLPQPKMYSTMIALMEQTNSQLVLCDMVSERNGCSFGLPWEDGTVLKNGQVTTELLASMVGNYSDDEKSTPVWGSVCRCVFLQSIIIQNNILFPTNISFAEDLVFTLRYSLHIDSVAICDLPLYYYTCNESSIMNSYYNYKKNMFEERKKLVVYVQAVINQTDASQMLKKRLETTERCYYHECIGNACRRIKYNTNPQEIHEEIKEIVNDEYVIAAFAEVPVKNIKKKIIYTLVKYKQVRILYEYYKLRLR